MRDVFLQRFDSWLRGRIRAWPSERRALPPASDPRRVSWVSLLFGRDRGGTGDTLRHAYAQAPVHKRYEPAERHTQRSDPDPGHERMIVETYSPGPMAVRLANRDV